MNKPLLPPIHSGKILRKEFMQPFGLSANALADEPNVRCLHEPTIAHAGGEEPLSTPRRGCSLFWHRCAIVDELTKRYELETACRAVGSIIKRDILSRVA